MMACRVNGCHARTKGEYVYVLLAVLLKVCQLTSGGGGWVASDYVFEILA